MHASVAPRCINRTLRVQYHTTYQTVSTLRYEVTGAPYLLFADCNQRNRSAHLISCDQSDFSQNITIFYCTLVVVADHIGDQCSSPG